MRLLKLVGVALVMLSPGVAAGYERDVHLSITLWLAELAGFTAREAYEIARNDEATDYDPATEPGTEDVANAFGDAAKQRRVDYHFVSLQRLEALRVAAKACTRGRVTQAQYRQLGHYLHALEDRHSHEGYGSDAGHWRDYHAPDKAWSPARDRNPRRTVSMIEAKFTALSELRATCFESTRLAGDYPWARRKVTEWAEEEVRNRHSRGRGDAKSPQRWKDLTEELYRTFYGDQWRRYMDDRATDFVSWLQSQRGTGWRTP